MVDLIFSLVMFVVIYLFYVIFVICRKKQLEKLKNNVGVIYLVNKYNLDLKKINMKVFGHVIALSNSFIFAVTLFIISFVDKLFLKILVCFVVLIPLEFIMYHIIGKMYGKKVQPKKRGK